MLTESTVVEAVTGFLKRQKYRVRHEVPNMGQSADIVATRSGRMTFVEAKIGHWRRAIGQCRAHESVADYICIALGLQTIPEGLHFALKESGYGLIVFSPSTRKCRWIKKPIRNKKVWSPQRQRITGLMRAIRYVD